MSRAIRVCRTANGRTPLVPGQDLAVEHTAVRAGRGVGELGKAPGHLLAPATGKPRRVAGSAGRGCHPISIRQPAIDAAQPMRRLLQR